MVKDIYEMWAIGTPILAGFVTLCDAHSSTVVNSWQFLAFSCSWGGIYVTYQYFIQCISVRDVRPKFFVVAVIYTQKTNLPNFILFEAFF